MAHEDFDYEYQSNVYATHQPYLETYVKATKGCVYEFGTGDGSTGLLRHLLRGTGRQLVSFEDNTEWLAKMQGLYPANEWHRYVSLNPREDGSHWKDCLDNLKRAGGESPSVVFIDQSPWEARLWTLEHFKGVADYCILHDTDYYARNGLVGRIIDESLDITDVRKYDFSDVFKNCILYPAVQPFGPRRPGPPTLVGTEKEGCMLVAFKDIIFN